ncbi:MAG TPA: efflux RND transporter periplasmic adaptor subunit [Gammaproteobacteria bacterium]|nr:efflux RND transporter periplasmic adaptor subunit [Gammaproteobacteria bacterium]
MRKLAVVAVIALAIGAGVWWYLRPEPVLVGIASVERGPVVASVANTRAGTVDACRRAGLSPALGGQINSLPVAEGSKVEEGELLLELWNEDIEAQLEQALREARAAQARTQEACVTADVARREANRLSALFLERAVSEDEADRAEGRAESTGAACAAARVNAEVSDARVDVVRAQLEKTRLRAPFAGVIAEINGELGEFVTPSPVGIPTPPTVDLIDSSCLYVSAPIDEIDAPLIRAGMTANIHLDAFPNRSFPGQVRRIAPYVLDLERQARTVEIEAEFDNPEEGLLLPGYSADVEVILDSRDDVVRVPSSIVRDGNRVFVYDPATGTLVDREIGIGVSNWEYTEVTSGLAEGDRIVSTVDREGVEDGAIVQPE